MNRVRWHETDIADKKRNAVKAVREDSLINMSCQLLRTGTRRIVLGRTTSSWASLRCASDFNGQWARNSRHANSLSREVIERILLRSSNAFFIVKATIVRITFQRQVRQP